MLNYFVDGDMLTYGSIPNGFLAHGREGVPMPTVAQKDAHAKYRKKAVKQVNVPFFPKEQFMYDFVGTQDNKAGYIKGLIERDMRENGYLPEDGSGGAAASLPPSGRGEVAPGVVRGVSLFAGAGGMDCGFHEAGVTTVFSNEIDRNAADTFTSNGKYVDADSMHVGDIEDFMPEIEALSNIDVVFGGPPCQGFSVAGKMNPDDERSKLVWTFMRVVEALRPRLFVMENVKALGALAKWQGVRDGLIDKARALGYGAFTTVLNASDYGVPQARERFFFIGVRGASDDALAEAVTAGLARLECDAPTVREAFGAIPAYGDEGNAVGSTAELRFAKHPVLRSSPYRGSLLFNGRGRPVDLDSVAKTLPAQMGGNHTPIIDQALLDDADADNWIAAYHAGLLAGEAVPDDAHANIPKHLRRMTVREAAVLQGFPSDYVFTGQVGKQYRQIGNAVPCGLAKAVATAALAAMDELSR